MSYLPNIPAPAWAAGEAEVGPPEAVAASAAAIPRRSAWTLGDGTRVPNPPVLRQSMLGSLGFLDNRNDSTVGISPVDCSTYNRAAAEAKKERENEEDKKEKKAEMEAAKKAANEATELVTQHLARGVLSPPIEATGQYHTASSTESADRSGSGNDPSTPTSTGWGSVSTAATLGSQPNMSTLTFSPGIEEIVVDAFSTTPIYGNMNLTPPVADSVSNWLAEQARDLGIAHFLHGSPGIRMPGRTSSETSVSSIRSETSSAALFGESGEDAMALASAQFGLLRDISQIRTSPPPAEAGPSPLAPETKQPRKLCKFGLDDDDYLITRLVNHFYYKKRVIEPAPLVDKILSLRIIKEMERKYERFPNRAAFIKRIPVRLERIEKIKRVGIDIEEVEEHELLKWDTNA